MRRSTLIMLKRIGIVVATVIVGLAGFVVTFTSSVLIAHSKYEKANVYDVRQRYGLATVDLRENELQRSDATSIQQISFRPEYSSVRYAIKLAYPLLDVGGWGRPESLMAERRVAESLLGFAVEIVDVSTNIVVVSVSFDSTDFRRNHWFEYDDVFNLRVESNVELRRDREYAVRATLPLHGDNEEDLIPVLIIGRTVPSLFF